MKHAVIDRIYGDVFMGEPVEPGETWPRHNVMLRHGTVITWVPENYEAAIEMFEMGRLEKVEMIHQELRILCVPMPAPKSRMAALRVAVEALADRRRRLLAMPTLLVEPPDEFCREAYVQALREAEALPDDDPDKAELLAVRHRDIWTFFDRPKRTPEERHEVLRRFLGGPDP